MHLAEDALFPLGTPLCQRHYTSPVSQCCTAVVKVRQRVITAAGRICFESAVGTESGKVTGMPFATDVLQRLTGEFGARTHGDRAWKKR